MGENFNRSPSIFDQAKEDFKNNIIQWGYTESFNEYAEWLWKADILPVTSNQEFFGASVMEAIYCQIWPILPCRLTYPELISSNDNEENFHEEIDDDPENFDYPATSPYEPPPIKSFEDVETIIELSPEEALYGSSILVELEDQTVVEVDTPPFAGDGWRLRLENVAKGGKDHYLHLKVQTENGLRIDGLRVIYKLELFPPDALLGCAVDVPTLDGNVTLQVPPKSSTGRMLRLKGRGLSTGDETGDQYVEIVVVIPADIKDEEIALYTRLQELSFSESA